MTAGGFLVPARPWPVTLVAEALAQAILLVDPPASADALRLVSLDGVRLFQEVGAGDRLEVAVACEGSFGSLRRYLCRATRAGALAAEARVVVSG